MAGGTIFGGLVHVATPILEELWATEHWQPGARLVGHYYGSRELSLELREDGTYSLARWGGAGDLAWSEFEVGTWQADEREIQLRSASSEHHTLRIQGPTSALWLSGANGEFWPFGSLCDY